jgi:DNA modification methylase
MNAKDELHPTEKPVTLVVNALKCSSRKDENILDLFGGSGVSLIACEQTNRICYMMELDPKYCDVIRKRYSKFIGKEETWQTETPVL